MKQVTFSQMETLADGVLEYLSPLSTAHVVALSGNLGAGKTTFTQHLSKKLGVAQSITSPTFVLMKRYSLENQKFDTLIHIDAYRLESADELRALDFETYLEDPKNLIVIEWPENVVELLPEERTNISFEVVDEDSRNVAITYAKG